MRELALKSLNDRPIRRSAFLEDLLNTAEKDGFIDEKQSESIKNALSLFMLRFLAENRKGGTYSLDKNHARELVNAGAYLISLELSEFSADEALAKVLSLNFEALCLAGKSKALKLFDETFSFAGQIINNPLSSANIHYAALVQKSLPEFFKLESEVFSPGVSPLLFSTADVDFDMSWPVVIFREDTAGIEKVHSYLRGLKIEIDFLRHFSANNISKSERQMPTLLDPFLGDADFETPKMFITTLKKSCEFVLCSASPFSLELNDEQTRHIELLFNGKTPEQKAEMFENAAKRLSELLALGEMERDYVIQAARTVSSFSIM